ncbi:Ubiquinone/menaquinone biosynthesis C-methylase UbiE [Paenibacillus sp. UNCCL117]|uniref:class I SAM-dependent methyltransferase n=1 Tax=unclassified Paenibacillus TaxID=185978 RepID=UPI0008885ADE|nr:MULTISPECIES: class I SAM-dependent methyltransferase [unclassified Paenibacillus]SDE25136.1 Ubiquinone/menaquinone biosynthesis C-methylase UbiE [Paenibacillus sp. cl123]SFW62353.1 Ubiquinone/menaquinone biosynthesis C-methylase UbiE [Paenibacillus sp. UNCCL117]
MSGDSKERFSNRVGDYVKYRPSYPAEAIDYLYSTVGMKPGSLIADVGAGTGIFSRLLLERGSEVVAVEPNQAMREAADRELGSHERYRSIAAAAEATGLPEESVDFIVCAQSFHWFDRPAAQAEFHRILKPGGKAVLIWNSRLTTGTPFLEGYEELLRQYSTDYAQMMHKNISPEQLRQFFRDQNMREVKFTNAQLFNLEELIGRALSSSYVPAEGQPNHEPLKQGLGRLFERTKENGRISFDYETEVFWGEV